VSKQSKRDRQRENREARRQYEEQLARRRRMFKTARTLAFILVPVLAVGVFLSLSKDDDKKETTNARRFKEAPPLTIDPTASYTATIETTEGTIVVALDAENAPTSVNNFVFLARKKFYDGLLFSRAATDFVIQAGSPENDGIGGPGYSVAAELPTGYQLGSVAWAKSGTEAPGTAGSQFFIGTGANITTLPVEYGIIGLATSGLDIAQRIEGFAPETGDGPLTTKVRIKKVTITETPGAATTSTTETGATP
jgi:cyclophilin family peptidyl-prolyl cis-trans isomerase